jgi:hypothetical protein
MDVSTQLRLLTKPEPAARPLRARPTPRRDRRAVHWQGQWRLDDRTREIGKAGVASARAALQNAHRDDLDAEGLRQAS